MPIELRAAGARYHHSKFGRYDPPLSKASSGSPSLPNDSGQSLPGGTESGGWSETIDQLSRSPDAGWRNITELRSHWNRVKELSPMMRALYEDQLSAAAQQVRFILDDKAKFPALFDASRFSNYSDVNAPALLSAPATVGKVEVTVSNPSPYDLCLTYAHPQDPEKVISPRFPVFLPALSVRTRFSVTITPETPQDVSDPANQDQGPIHQRNILTFGIGNCADTLTEHLSHRLIGFKIVAEEIPPCPDGATRKDIDGRPGECACAPCYHLECKPGTPGCDQSLNEPPPAVASYLSSLSSERDGDAEQDSCGDLNLATVQSNEDRSGTASPQEPVSRAPGAKPSDSGINQNLQCVSNTCFKPRSIFTNEERSTCSECPPNSEPNEERTACVRREEGDKAPCPPCMKPRYAYQNDYQLNKRGQRIKKRYCEPDPDKPYHYPVSSYSCESIKCPENAYAVAIEWQEFFGEYSIKNKDDLCRCNLGYQLSNKNCGQDTVCCRPELEICDDAVLSY